MEENKKPQETDAEKIARIEQALADKDAEIENYKAQVGELTKKINSLKIDGLVKKVEPTKQSEPEERVFDFDMEFT